MSDRKTSCLHKAWLSLGQSSIGASSPICLFVCVRERGCPSLTNHSAYPYWKMHNSQRGTSICIQLVILLIILHPTFIFQWADKCFKKTKQNRKTQEVGPAVRFNIISIICDSFIIITIISLVFPWCALIATIYLINYSIPDVAEW